MCSMLHAGHIGRFGCIFRCPEVPFGMVFDDSGDPFPSVLGRLWEEFVKLASVTLKIRAGESPIVPEAPLRNMFREDAYRKENGLSANPKQNSTHHTNKIEYLHHERETNGNNQPSSTASIADK